MLGTLKLGLIAGAAALAMNAAWWTYAKHLENQVGAAQNATQTAETNLRLRVAAEKETIAAAVLQARADDQKALHDQQERYDQLLQRARAADVAVSDAADRLRKLATSTASCSSRGDVPGSAAAAGRVQDAAAGKLSDADRNLIDGLLQVARDANSAAAGRNYAATEYQMNCERKNVH